MEGVFPKGIWRIDLTAKLAGAELTIVIDGREAVHMAASRGIQVTALTAEDRVLRAKQLLADGKKYSKGCSDFVCDVLEIGWRSAASLMGSNTTSVGSNGNYSGASPGDIIGWVAEASVPGHEHDHVAVYIGEQDTGGPKIIDVHDVGEAPRRVNSYGKPKVYKSDNL